MDTIERDLDDFARTHVVASRVVEVDVAMAFRSHHIPLFALANDDGRASVIVAGGDDAVLGEDNHRARAFHLIIYVLYAVDEILALRDEQCHQLGGIGGTRTQFGKVLTAVETMADQLVQVVDFGHRSDGKLAEMRVHHNRLCIRVADDANADVAGEFAQLVAELRAEIRILDVVDRTVKKFAVVGHHTSTFGAQMRVIVNAIEQVLDASVF